VRGHSVACRPEAAGGSFLKIVIIIGWLYINEGRLSGWQNACYIDSSYYAPDLLNAEKNKEIALEEKIRWESDMKKALERAASESKSVLIFFHNPA
jgi:hypothetical protein